MTRFSIKRLCVAMGAVGLLATGGASAFPSASFFPKADGTVVEWNDGQWRTLTRAKPIYINGYAGHILDSEDFWDMFAWTDDGIKYIAGRERFGSAETPAGCTDTPSPAIHIPDDITLGTPYVTNGTLTRTCNGNTAYNTSFAFTATFTPVLFENVTVPAGTYKALKYTFRFQAPSVSIDDINTNWAVPKVGAIKWTDGVDVDQASFISSNVPNAGNADFDGDGKSDPAVFRTADGTWLIHNSSNNTDTTRVFGIANDTAVNSDYDGDGVQDFAVYRSSTGEWYILKSSTNYTKMLTVPWGGVTNDRTVQRDYDGDGVTDIGIYRPGTGYWYILTSSTGFDPASAIIKQFGVSGDQQVPRDYDGDGKVDLAVFRPSTGNWYWTTAASGYTDVNEFQGWGKSGDQPMAQDYDGDGKADLAIYRPSNGTWYIRFSSSNYTTSLTKAWGIPTGSYTAGTSDTNATGDFDGDRIADIAIFRPSNGTWYVLTSSSGFNSSITINSNGTTGDLPVARR